jgi:glycosyltransferase involved in cell wall biosynthesis
MTVALLTGCGDKPYAVGLGTTLLSQQVGLEIIGGDDLDVPAFRAAPAATFLNLRGSQNSAASFGTKVLRILMYYVRLIAYAITARPKIFHILWNNKFEYFDRTVMIGLYKAFGKKIVLTVHNVNIGKRDATDSLANRLTLRMQYRLADHLFVHTEKMKAELTDDFGVSPSKISVIPFGINNTVPATSMTGAEARRRLGLGSHEKVLLFFGSIAPYKGLEYLVAACQISMPRHSDYRLVVAGSPKGDKRYWSGIYEQILGNLNPDQVTLKIEFVPDEDTETYFKAADVLVLPYRRIFQSGVLFLGYSFGLPVLAADVGSLKDDIVQGVTGLVFHPEDSTDLARAIDQFFSSDMFEAGSSRRTAIQEYANAKYSWDTVGTMTRNAYATLVGKELTERTGALT